MKLKTKCKVCGSNDWELGKDNKGFYLGCNGCPAIRRKRD